MIQPIPPPSVRPATPVCVTMPDGTARPNAWVSRSSSPSSTPACTLAVRFSGSTRTPFIGERSIINASSATESPGNECPPLRTATGNPVLRPNLTAEITSATPAQRAISAGWRSIEPFQILRCSSYDEWVVGTTSPRKVPSSSASAVSSSMTPSATAIGPKSASPSRSSQGEDQAGLVRLAVMDYSTYNEATYRQGESLRLAQKHHVDSEPRSKRRLGFPVTPRVLSLTRKLHVTPRKPAVS